MTSFYSLSVVVYHTHTKGTYRNKTHQHSYTAKHIIRTHWSLSIFFFSGKRQRQHKLSFMIFISYNFFCVCCRVLCCWSQPFILSVLALTHSHTHTHTYITNGTKERKNHRVLTLALVLVYSIYSPGIFVKGWFFLCPEKNVARYKINENYVAWFFISFSQSWGIAFFYYYMYCILYPLHAIQ